MSLKEKEEFWDLYARLEDLCRYADRGELGQSSFLSPRELHYGKQYLDRKGAQSFCYGGYEEAERKKLYVLPDYIDGEDIEKNNESNWIKKLKEFGLVCGVSVLRITGSGYRSLTHRDFLGALLGLGLERSVLGDILIDGEKGKSAVVFCDTAIAGFIEKEMTDVANDKVKISEISGENIKLPAQSYAAIHDTVASPRLDCVVAALCGLSREKARETVCGGFAEINFESEDRPDRTVTAPALLSVRGYGRYRILSLSDRTKKGRYRMEAEKYL